MVRFSLPDGTSVAQRVANPPTCVDRHAPTTLTEVGMGTQYVTHRGSRIPPHILPPGTPPPLHWDLINVTDGWIVSDGYSLVAVYAGAPGVDPSRGRFAIIRQNSIVGIQYAPPDIVDIPNAGALTIKDWPWTPAGETALQHGELAFTSENGVNGILYLRTDRVRVTATTP